MDSIKCISSTDVNSGTCDETSFDDESELNTADLSHISGLSKILCVDDSIADRVRCLLASDTEDGDREKPELLSSGKELPSGDELAERISKLLQDGDSTRHTDDRPTHGSNDDNISSAGNSQSEAVLVSATSDEKKNLFPEMSEKVTAESPDRVISTATIGRRSGDGADNEPTTITAESSDDIMNVSDATEYSDLPKVVDNPIKRLSTGNKPSSQQISCSEGSGVVKPSKCCGINEEEEPERSVKCILGASKPTAEDDEKTVLQSIQAKEKILSLSPIDMHEVNTLGRTDLTKDKLMEDKPIAQSDENATGKRDVIGSLRNVSHSRNAPNLEGCLSDDKLLQKFKKTVSSSTLDSDSIKGSHTSSAQSIASSVDSLGLKVKNLLKEKKLENVCDANTSSASNYSEEIYNFEKTNLWKYTRQFLPGAISQPSSIQPRAKFSDVSSPIVGKDMTDSSTSSTPVTYRLAREVVTPVNRSPYLEKDSFHQSYTGYRQSPEARPSSDRNVMDSFTLDRAARSSGIGMSTTISNKDSGSKFCPRPSTYSAIPSSSKDSTPASSSYKSLYPQYSDTPYSFITPRRVAWEPSSTHRKIEPLERSAYFNPDRFSDVQSYPTPVHRTSAAPYRRLTPDVLVKEFPEQQSLTQKNKTTSTSERSVEASHGDIPTRSNAHSSDTYSCSRMRPSPKSVRFENTTSPSKSERHSNDAKSASLPEYSFTTPRTTNRPGRNITPKVDRENPRPCKSLPTYDQMVMEEVCRKSHAEKGHDGAMLSQPEISSVQIKRSPDKENVIRSSTPTVLSQASQPDMGFSLETGTFSALKPEICLEESACEDDIVRLTAIETDGNARLSRDIVYSDARLYAAISPDKEAAVTSCHDQTNSTAEDNDAPMSCHIETQVEGLDPPLIATEPAPLPYVRLGRKRAISPFRKGHIPPHHSISTEKVQNLLMKEAVPRTGGVSVDFSHTVAVADCSSSSDDDLLNLMETVASKVPLMQKLLKKLYDRNIERKNTQDSKLRNSTNKNADQPTTVDQSVQTMSSPSKISQSASHKGSKPIVRDTLAESSCQTSLLKPAKRVLVAHKATSPMEDFDRDEEGAAIVQDAYDEDKCNKENMVETKQPCAFFVDMTPKKSGKLDNAATEIGERQSVAWYEPYKYVPFWKKEQAQRKTFGFVDANVQDAFLNNKRDFVLRSWERQEDIAHRAQERRLRELEQNIHDQIKALHKEKTFKIASSTRPVPVIPKKKKERMFGWKEMKIASKQKYDALPEVVAKKQEAERLKYYETNRKRADMYKRRITQMIVQKQRGKTSTQVQ